MPAAPSRRPPRRRRALVWAALGVVYVVWGSTYLAIRVAIETLPPFLTAATRFLVAGAVLFALSAPRGDRAGDRLGPAQWRATAIVGAALLLGGNGGVVWAEQRIPSGVAALLVAMLPLWMALARSAGLRPPARPPRRRRASASGFAGLALLVGPDRSGRRRPAGRAGLHARVAVVGRRLALRPHRAPAPPAARGDGMEMLAGGALLAIVGHRGGRARAAHLAAFSTASLLALAYLIVFGSLLAFSAYVWLLRHAPSRSSRPTPT